MFNPSCVVHSRQEARGSRRGLSCCVPCRALVYGHVRDSCELHLLRIDNVHLNNWILSFSFLITTVKDYALDFINAVLIKV